jgi:hypothetical protein
MTKNLERLRSIKSFPALVKYLRDELDWPIESEDVDLLSFEYDAEELGLDAKTTAKIKEIKQLRPFVTGQPWGIFYINFEPKQLPVVALRRILSKLVLKKRASGNKALQASWLLNDLLFISSYGESEERAISFAHFSEDKVFGDLPTLRVLGWDSEDTVLRLEDVEQTLTNKLHWPEDESNVDDWRKSWSSAFTLRPREVIRTSKELAIKLADLATLIRARVNQLLAIESEKGPLRKLLKAFQEALIHDLDEDGFADMYAQTIAYGLLTARVSRPAGLIADNIHDLPNTNPFLKEQLEAFLTVGGRKGKIDFDELGVNEVVELLRNANMESVLKDFGDRNPQEDPVIHFYELFLKEYDPEKRMKRGVFYTPRPVVSFIVRSVDEILRSEFGLDDGLADTTTWGQIAKRHEGLTIPKGVKPDEPFVQILDPATGTGTFLVEVIDMIYQTLRAKWTSEKKNAREMDELWNEYVPRHLLPRLHGFELMMAPYAIAHMKIGLKLRETHYSFLSSERARIYLTNTLEEPKDFSGYLEQMAPALAHEAGAANKVKKNAPITVIIGNPPYSKMSANLNEDAVNLVEAFRYLNGQKIVEKGALAFELSLQDDYVKFFGFMLKKVGSVPLFVSSYISNFRYLDSNFLRGLRKTLIDTSSSLNFVNLGGHVANRKGLATADDNVFDIEQGVALSFIRKDFSSSGNQARYFRSFGTRAEKYDFLLERSIDSVEFSSLTPTYSLYKFTNDTGEREGGFDSWFGLEEIFQTNSGSIITSRDNLAINFDVASLYHNIKAFASSPSGDRKLQNQIGFSVKSKWDVEACKQKLRDEKVPRKHIRELLYRPFDIRQIYYFRPLLDTPSRPVCSVLEGGDNLVILSPKVKTTSIFTHVLISRLPAEKKVASHDRATQMFPLWLDKKGIRLLQEGSQRVSNINSKFTNQLRQSLGIDPKDESQPDPQAVLHYIYAVLHSPVYRDTYGDEFRDNFPRIPLTSDVELFRRLCALGADLVALHLLEDDYEFASWNTSQPNGNNPFKTLITRLAGKEDAEVAKGYPKYKDGNVYIKPSCYFEGLPEEVWNFHIGGYQVCEKWLKDRRGRTLSDEDINHYQRVVVALNETIRLMAEIDRVIEEHGGWPLVGAEKIVSSSYETVVLPLGGQPALLPLPAQVRFSQPDHGVYMMRVILSMLRESGESIKIEKLMNACSLLAMPDSLETYAAKIEPSIAHEWRTSFSDHFMPDLFIAKIDDLVQRGEIRLIREGSGFKMVRVGTLALPTDAHIEFDAWLALRVSDSLVQKEKEAFPPLATREQLEERSSAA